MGLRRVETRRKVRETVKILVIALSIAALGVACGGDDEDSGTQAGGTTTTSALKPDEDAGDFIQEIFQRSLRGQYGRNWETLHPAHQKVVSREKYDACESQDDESVAAKISVDVLETYEEPVLLEGSGTVDSTAVTLRFSYDNPLTGKPAEEHATVHAVAVDGEWKWILRPEDYGAYVKGDCPPED
jgi:hypothetical protein